MPDTIESIFGLVANFTFKDDVWNSGTISDGNGSGGNLGDPTLHRHHVNPTALANSLSLFKALGQVYGESGVLYDHYSFSENGLRLPATNSRAQELLRSSNAGNHEGYREALAVSRLG
jgi:hypothetical protein